MTLSNVLKPNMKGLFYGRYSTEHQDINRQRQMAIDLVNEYNCEIINFNYVDKGVSARKNPINKRRYLQKIINELDNFKYDFIIVSEEDRLARKPIEHQLLRTTFLSADIPVVICKTKTLYNSPNTDVLVQLISDGISQYEAQNIKANTRNGIKARIKSGLWTGGQPVYGYRYDKETGKFYTYEEELNIVKKIFDLYEKGLGFKAIANDLDPKFNKGNPWTKDKVKGIVTSPFYSGYLSWGKRTGKSNNSFNPDIDSWILIDCDSIPAIIDKEKWHLCWKFYMEKRENKITPKHYNTNFLLKDLAYCKHCKQPLETKNQKTCDEKYGSIIYRCKPCGVRCEAETLHDEVITKTLNDIIATDRATVLQSLKQKFIDEINLKEIEITSLKNAGGKYHNQIHEINFKLHEMMKDTREERDKQIISIVSLLKLELKNRLDNTLKLIEQKTKEIKILQEIDCDEKHLLSLIEAANKDYKKMANYELRKILLNFIKTIEIDKQNKLTFINRINLKKQVNPQSELYLH